MVFTVSKWEYTSVLTTLHILSHKIYTSAWFCVKFQTFISTILRMFLPPLLYPRPVPLFLNIQYHLPLRIWCTLTIRSVTVGPWSGDPRGWRVLCAGIPPVENTTAFWPAMDVADSLNGVFEGNLFTGESYNEISWCFSSNTCNAISTTFLFNQNLMILSGFYI